MKLFSWFIKVNKHPKPAQEGFTTAVSNNITDEEISALNHNTMWPIAKVKTATMIIKKPKKKMNKSQSPHKYETTKASKAFIGPIPLG
ncbi:MAG: hypothetical protein ACI9O3_000290 [Colwellia sp.]|jgi:hypothetical protein